MFNTSLNNAGHGALVESYVNGSDFYRVYADGWIEQGGFINSMTNNVNYTLNILKPFKDTNYNVQCVSSVKQHFMCPVSKTESTITFHTVDVSYNTNTGCYWFSCGY